MDGVDPTARRACAGTSSELGREMSRAARAVASVVSRGVVARASVARASGEARVVVVGVAGRDGGGWCGGRDARAGGGDGGARARGFAASCAEREGGARARGIGDGGGGGGGAGWTRTWTRGMQASARAALDVRRPGHREGTRAETNEGKKTKEDGMGEYEEIPRGASAAKLDEANDERALTAVHTAIGCNTAILVCKLGAYGMSGSPSMLAESIHSVADIVNQALLQVGITNSNRKPDATFNYGYRRERFVYSLISAVGIFFLGAGFSVMHGIHGLMSPAPSENIKIGIAVLLASAILESFSLKVAYKSLRDNAAAQNMTLGEFVKSGKDPTSVSVLAEDAAAVLGCGIAGTALLAAEMTGNPMYDALGSIAVGGLLGTTAMYLINSNRLLLLGRSLGADKMQAITEHMRRDPVVEEVYFAKSEELGAGTYRFAAEVEFSGKKIVERYLAKNKRRMELHSKFNEAALSGDMVAMDVALSHYGEGIVQAVGDEVDRMEKEIVKIEPSIHYVDIETN